MGLTDYIRTVLPQRLLMSIAPSDLVRSANAFRKVLDGAKHSVQPIDFKWYPYDSLMAVPYQIDPLLQAGGDILNTEKSLPLLDLGCGDGDLAFFFESLGFRVVAVDCQRANFNQMRGVEALKTALGSSVSVQSTDLDGHCQIAGGPFGIVLMSGLLYHLKNPFQLLEYAAEMSHYCVLTTRIAQKSPLGLDMKGEALAYLVDPEELNHDSTNYWIFSEKGLRRLFMRTGWDLCHFFTTGCRVNSDLTDDRDERACCLLRSRITLGSSVQP